MCWIALEVEVEAESRVEVCEGEADSCDEMLCGLLCGGCCRGGVLSERCVEMMFEDGLTGSGSSSEPGTSSVSEYIRCDIERSYRCLRKLLMSCTMKQR